MFRFTGNDAMLPTARIQLQRACVEAEGYLELGMPQHALHTLQRRGQLVHGDARGCYLLGETLRELRRYRDAVYPLRRCQELLPDDMHVALALGWCLKRTGRLHEAINALERVVKVEPEEAILHYNLACYWSLARNKRQALMFLERALLLDSAFRNHIDTEHDFDPIREDSEFQAITSITV